MEAAEEGVQGIEVHQACDGRRKPGGTEVAKKSEGAVESVEKDAVLLVSCFLL